jgi:choline dehydrogenase-like flavoprotein
MYLHGLALTPEIQREEKLLNASIFFAPDLAPDDPWEAFKRLIRLESKEWVKDLGRVVRDISLLIKALGVKFVQNRRVPDWLRNAIVNLAIRIHPNLVAEEFISQGVPHKLTGLRIKAITEQVPNRDSRVTLSDQKDEFGIPRAKIDWRIDDLERTTLLRITELARDAIIEAGMPAPVLADWVNTRRIDDAVIIDMAHTVGTTRMSRDPRFGVVDANCKIHGLENLYVSGGSVFPTAGHTNPTLMFVAFAIRLADHLNARLNDTATPMVEAEPHQSPAELAIAS